LTQLISLTTKVDLLSVKLATAVTALAAETVTA